MPLDSKKIPSLNHYRYILSDEYQVQKPQMAVVFIKNAVYYGSLLVPYYPPDYRAIFIHSCTELPPLLEQYGGVEYLTSSEITQCDMSDFTLTPLYNVAHLEASVLTQKHTNPAPNSAH